MSYILDALRKAEAERRIGASATSQASTVLGAQFDRAPQRPARIWWLLLPAVAAAAAGGVWFGASQTKTPAVTATAPATTPSAPPQPQPVAPVAEKVAPAPENTAPPAIAATPSVQKAEPEQAQPPKESVRHKAPDKKPRVTAAERKPAPRPVAAEEPRVPGLRELPEAIQREIPPLAIGGYLYSGNKADRTVLINTKLLREGDEVAPGLRLETLMSNGMVLNFKGHRYRMPY
ncbi:MAG TPA: general secretion pathway protein GspB [Noviherbaspirillum sp.]|uniref:general secretion pathway protein GspB n=1 Tax=Noviherbaspirillum sp. TaxID=1926288 RepID=UPI002B4A5046|nr:general secretion pathway protein GspB [Noviherbaspirillum sp.]HJV86180.1 general secretion pathway protein GspB [Noviherbaspirillum sp.]